MSWLKNQFAKAKGDDEDQYVNQNFSFSDIDDQRRRVITLGTHNPDTPYMVVYPGLNLRGKCVNPKCIAKPCAWVQKGYGTFHLQQVIDDVYCPVCKQQLPYETVDTLGYRNARVKMEGRKKGASKKFQYEDLQTEGKLIEFDGYEGTVQWIFLKLTVSKP